MTKNFMGKHTSKVWRLENPGPVLGSIWPEHKTPSEEQGLPVLGPEGQAKEFGTCPGGQGEPSMVS